MKKLYNIYTLLLLIILFFSTIDLNASGRMTMYLRLSDCVRMALKDNPSIELIEVKIKQIDLDLNAMEETYRKVPLVTMQIKERKKSLENQKKEIIDMVSLNIYNLYYDAMVAEKKAHLAKLDAEYYSSYLEKNRANYEAGRIDRLTLQSIEDAFQKKVEAKKLAISYLERANITLLVAINKKVDYELHLTDDISFEDDATDVAVAEVDVINDNRDLVLLAHSIETRKLEYQALDRESASSNQLEKAKLLLKESILTFQKRKRELITDLWKRYLQVSDAAVHVETTKDSVKYYNDRYDSTSDRYKQGLVTQDDVNFAHVAKLSAMVSYKDAVKNFIIAKFNYNLLFEDKN